MLAHVKTAFGIVRRGLMHRDPVWIHKGRKMRGLSALFLYFISGSVRYMCVRPSFTFQQSSSLIGISAFEFMIDGWEYPLVNRRANMPQRHYGIMYTGTEQCIQRLKGFSSKSCSRPLICMISLNRLNLMGCTVK